MTKMIKKKQRLCGHEILTSISTLKALLRKGAHIRRSNLKENNFYRINKNEAKLVPGFKLLMLKGRYKSNDILAKIKKMIIFIARREVNAMRVPKFRKRNYCEFRFALHPVLMTSVKIM